MIGGFILLKIDGSQGEGGGQILRNSVALSVLTNKPIEIINIRANRPNPGIKPQHYISIQGIKELCDAQTEGLEVGSSVLTFKPGKIKGGNYKFDIGTAGSIALVFQACIMSCFSVSEPVTLRITGGTDVKWAPSWDYFEHIFLPMLKKMGFTVKPNLIKRGYYPKGGGEAEIKINPCSTLKPLQLNFEPVYENVEGIINISSLPEHISKRIQHTVIKNMLKRSIMSAIKVKKYSSPSPGTGITIWSSSKKSIIGSTFLGEKSISSEELGEMVTNELLSDIDSGATLDVYAFDQLLPYMVLARNNGPSTCIVRNISNHTQTNMWLLKQFFDVDFKISQLENNLLVTVR